MQLPPPENQDDLSALLQAVGLDESGLDLLLSAAPNRERIRNLLNWMALRPGETETLGATPFAALAAEVDASQYSLGAWMDALDAMREWLIQRRLHANFADALGYLGCCASAFSGGPGIQLELRGVVLDALDRYGMEVATPSPA